MINHPRRLTPGLRALLLLLVLPLTLPSVVQARELHWSAIEVEAHIDAEGLLHVAERQTMVFDGDWNGGERYFSLGIWHKLRPQGITRIDASGTRIPLVKGDLEAVDEYAWQDGNTLRWRSRLPSEPLFEQETITYLLEYTLSRALAERDGTYYLDHDFAFANRPGVIERFTLDLTFDPVWLPRSRPPAHTVVQNLPPGRGVVIEAALTYEGPGSPGAALSGVPWPFSAAAFAASLLAMGWLYRRFRHQEAALGRYEQPQLPAALDPAWLESHLFDLRPEEVGALWDHQVGPPEVAAVLARLVAEGKLSSEVRESGWLRKRKVLTLKLETERIAFESYERKLLDKLFFDGRKETDTDAIRKHYRKKGKGFDPAKLIRTPIERRLESKAFLGRPPKAPSARLTWQLWGAFALLLVLAAVTRGMGVLMLLGFFGLVYALPIIVGFVCANLYRRWTRRLPLASLGLFALALLFLMLGFLGSLTERLLGLPYIALYPGYFGVLALALFPLALFSLWLRVARTRDAVETVRKRNLLGAIRRRLAAELERPEPALDDAWFPYLLAFGLNHQVDRWFDRFGGVSSTHLHGTSTSYSTSSSPSSSWSGGGGAFGGAGATASWAAAATGMASGVASPSSGSGGGGGGSSSGGGGGGGW